MANIDLADYNLSELKGLLFDIDKEIKARQGRALSEARERIRAIAEKTGLPTEELLAGGATTPRYRNPLNASQTWSGRGRQPKWVSEALAQGTTLEELRF
jgi:DNA-binding protein H-NS